MSGLNRDLARQLARRIADLLANGFERWLIEYMERITGNETIPDQLVSVRHCRASPLETARRLQRAKKSVVLRQRH